MSLWWCDNCKGIVAGQTPGRCGNCGGATSYATIHAQPMTEAMQKKAATFSGLVTQGVFVHAPEEPSDVPDPDYDL